MNNNFLLFKFNQYARISMKLNLILLITAVFLLFSCNSEQDTEKLEETSLEDVLEKGESINNNIKIAEQKWEMRRRKGDTLPIDYKVLIGIMPDIKGYTKQQPEGMNIVTNGTSYSSAIQQYDGSDGEINISIFDYNGEINMLTAASGWKAKKIKVEDEEGFHSSEPYYGFKDTWIYTEYNKINKNAIVILAINDRFILSVNANGQDNVDFAKKIAEQILSNNKDLFSK